MDAAVILLLVLKAAVVGLAVYPLARPGSSDFAGKAMGFRAIVYPGFMLLIPAAWLLSGRPSPYPVAADILLAIPFLVDAGANVLGLFAIKGFDVIPHLVGWLCLSACFGPADEPDPGRALDRVRAGAGVRGGAGR